MEIFTTTTFCLLLICLALSVYLVWSMRRYNTLESKEAHTQQNLDSAILELQHRVRNNLQVVNSLVELQGVEATLRGPESASRNIAYRVRAVSSAQDISTQQKSDRVGATELVKRIVAIHYPQASVSEIYSNPIFLTTKQATALALVVNEVLLDAKRRFLPNTSATLKTTDDQITVTLSLKPIAREDTASLDDLSKQIIETLVKHDLQGLYRIEVGSELFEVTFPQMFARVEASHPLPQSVDANKPPTMRRREALGNSPRVRQETHSFED